MSPLSEFQLKQNIKNKITKTYAAQKTKFTATKARK